MRCAEEESIRVVHRGLEDSGGEWEKRWKGSVGLIEAPGEAVREGT